MTTRRQFLTGAVAVTAVTVFVPLVAESATTHVLANDIKPGDVITISGVRGVNGLLKQFVVARVDASGAELSIADHAGKVHSVPARRAQPWPRHHKRDRWA